MCARFPKQAADGFLEKRPLSPRLTNIAGLGLSLQAVRKTAADAGRGCRRVFWVDLKFYGNHKRTKSASEHLLIKIQRYFKQLHEGKMSNFIYS